MKNKIALFDGRMIDSLNFVDNRNILKDFHKQFGGIYMKKFEEDNVIWTNAEKKEGEQDEENSEDEEKE